MKNHRYPEEVRVDDISRKVDRFNKSFSRCVKCGELMFHSSGKLVSKEAWRGLSGVCNDCLKKE